MTFAIYLCFSSGLLRFVWVCYSCVCLENAALSTGACGCFHFIFVFKCMYLCKCDMLLVIIHVVLFFRFNLSMQYMFLLAVFTRADCFRLLSISLFLSICGERRCIWIFNEEQRKAKQIQDRPTALCKNGNWLHCSVVQTLTFEEKRWSRGLFLRPLCFFFFVQVNICFMF